MRQNTQQQPTARQSTAQHTKKRAKEDRTTRSSPQRHMAGHNGGTISTEHGKGRQHKARHTYPGTGTGQRDKKNKVGVEGNRTAPRPRSPKARNRRKQKPETTGAQGTRGKKKEGGQKKTQRATPRAAGARKHTKPETVGAPAMREGGENQEKKPEEANHIPVGAEHIRTTKRPKER